MYLYISETTIINNENINVFIIIFIGRVLTFKKLANTGILVTISCNIIDPTTVYITISTIVIIVIKI